jgi:hypothetical protein
MAQLGKRGHRRERSPIANRRSMPPGYGYYPKPLGTPEVHFNQSLTGPLFVSLILFPRGYNANTCERSRSASEGDI